MMEKLDCKDERCLEPPGLENHKIKFLRSSNCESKTKKSTAANKMKINGNSHRNTGINNSSQSLNESCIKSKIPPRSQKLNKKCKKYKEKNMKLLDNEALENNSENQLVPAYVIHTNAFYLMLDERFLNLRISDQIFQISSEACTSGEKIAINNKRRYCYRNLQYICAKTNEHVKKTHLGEVNFKLLGIPWAIKNLIFASVRMLDGWKCLNVLLLEKHECYDRIESTYYSPCIRQVFYEWQVSTRTILAKVCETFTVLDQEFQKKKVESLPKSLQTNIKMLNENSIYHNISEQLNMMQNNVMEEIMKLTTKKGSEQETYNNIRNSGKNIIDNQDAFTLKIKNKRKQGTVNISSSDEYWEKAKQTATKLINNISNKDNINGVY